MATLNPTLTAVVRTAYTTLVFIGEILAAAHAAAFLAHLAVIAF